MPGSSSLPCPQPSSCLLFAALCSTPGGLLLSPCVCADTVLLLGQAHEPSLSLSPWGSVQELPSLALHWGSTGLVELCASLTPNVSGCKTEMQPMSQEPRTPALP